MVKRLPSQMRSKSLFFCSLSRHLPTSYADQLLVGLDDSSLVRCVQ